MHEGFLDGKGEIEEGLDSPLYQPLLLSAYAGTVSGVWLREQRSAHQLAESRDI